MQFVCLGFLAVLTGTILSHSELKRSEGGNVERLSTITKPVANLLIQVINLLPCGYPRVGFSTILTGSGS